MEIEISDADVDAFGGDRDKLAAWVNGLPLETDRLKARQSVIDSTKNELKAFTDLGLTPAEIKSLQAKPGGPTEADIEKLIKDRVKESEDANRARSDAKARSSEVRAQAAELGFIKPPQALALLDPAELAKVSVTDDGDADAAAVKKLLEDLSKDNPHLLKTSNTPGHRDAGIGARGAASDAAVRPGTDRLRGAYEASSKK
ncbi:hypothetical protein AB0P19_02280 [Microbacterium oleivorans]|uniref:hypothetical protein n=1 Tax=Microbacterium oleivorans TaxID=273677 RepID=UPI00341F5984